MKSRTTSDHSYSEAPPRLDGASNWFATFGKIQRSSGPSQLKTRAIAKVIHDRRFVNM
jgi:hypothetical protein